MRVFVVTPPAPVITWANLNGHLRLEGDETERTYIEGLAEAATGHIDGPTGWLGRSLGAQTLEARMDNFGCGRINLPCPEILSIVSVKYIDADGVEQTVPSDQYDLIGNSIEPAYGKSWPRPRMQREAVRIRYTAGYSILPGPIRSAILLMVGDLFANRETVVTGTISSQISMSTTVENLLTPYRQWC